MQHQFASIRNNESIPLNSIPILDYETFRTDALDLLKNDSHHCVQYYAYINKKISLKFICIIADDHYHFLHVASHEIQYNDSIELESLTQSYFPLHIFEREISENFGVKFKNHPWLKPVRFPKDRHNQELKINDYPFYQIESDELHEVGVGPIHAGVIEPGHFRFICNGEMVLHLEIQNGWQHRGVEQLFLNEKSLLQRLLLAESIAGDTVVGHALAFVQSMEAACSVKVSERLNAERGIALELERIAVHVGDMSALCTDVAYQLGTNVFGALRTPIINFLQSWCGNRFAKGLIRVGGTNYPLNQRLVHKLGAILQDFETRFKEAADRTYSLPSVENRFDDIGTVSNEEAKLLGTVGMAARMSGISRDIRASHPFGIYIDKEYKPALTERGDVYARFLLRRLEIEQSIDYIRLILKTFDFRDDIAKPKNERDLKLKSEHLTVSLTEGWRGEICHVLISDNKSQLFHYKIKDPSIHNWKALELSLRNLEISDFPINNKSYNLSYCGHDL